VIANTRAKAHKAGAVARAGSRFFDGHRFSWRCRESILPADNLLVSNTAGEREGFAPSHRRMTRCAG
jgi:hypothetical protein